MLDRSTVLGFLLIAVVGCTPPAASPLPNASSATVPTSSPSTGSTMAPSDPTALPSSATLPNDAVFAVTLEGRDGRRSIATVSIDGTTVTTRAPGQDPSWSADGRSIVFACLDSAASPRVTGICSILQDGSGLRPLVIGAAVDDPRWSPDGMWLTYGKGEIDVGTAWIARADASETHLLVEGSAPIWSADSRWLAYQPEGAVYEVAVIRPDGSGTQVVSGGYDPAWSPTGAHLVFARWQDPMGSLVVVSVGDGSMSTAFETASTVHHPAWIGSQEVAFWMDGDLWRLGLDADASPVRLTTGLAVEDGAALSVSPDGDWLLFAASGLPGAEVHLVSVNGGWTPVPIEDGAASQPVWQPAR